jgi:predicted transposase/invertase (TIGR01784 family)
MKKIKHEESLKYYRDLKNVVDTSFVEGKIEGKIVGKIEGKLEVAAQMKRKGMSDQLIAEITGLSLADIKKI